LRIGSVEILNRIVLAPMAGITDKAFRLIARMHGCGLIYTEMISAKALTYKNMKTKILLDLTGEEKPIAVQLFGSDPEIMAEAAIIVEKEGAQIIDINMGCPVPKVVKNGEGSALLEKPELACEIVRTMRQAVKVPITVKIRSGFRPENIVALQLSIALAKAGASAIGIHPRTRDQYYSGKSDWQVIKKIKDSVDIPVIGSGDIWIPEDVEEMLEITRCDAVMLGRGVLGNPWLISNTRDYLSGTAYKRPTAEEKVKGALFHLDLIIQLKGEEIGVKEMRKNIAWYLKGLPRTAMIKESVFKAKTRAEVFNLLDQYILMEKS